MPQISSDIREELRAQTVDGLTQSGDIKYVQISHFVWMTKAQDQAIHVLLQEKIPVVVIKGTASGMYYPKPYLRSYGDIDLLVQPENYEKAICTLRTNGWVQEGDIGDSHTALYKNDFLVELHQQPPGLDGIKEKKYIIDYLLSGFSDVQEGVIDQPKCVFPMLPWKQNGLELIWHFREHLYNGIGLRHVIDWMMFVNAKLHTNEAFEEFRPVLEQAGLLMLAKSVARMCQLYLGLDSSIQWCAGVGEDTCAELMDFILEQGNFGHKKVDDKAAKVMTRYSTPLAFMKGMQNKGLNEWLLVQKYPLLSPVAWIYSLRQGLSRYLQKGGIRQFREDLSEKARRQKMFTQLYGEKVVSQQITMPHAILSSSSTLVSCKVPLKQRIRPLYERISHSPMRAPLYYLQNLFFLLRYPLFGKPKISDADQKNVEQNVTFIFKSFNRQNLAKRCYRVIKSYYPKARVVIADDSKEPLKIDNIAEGDLILHLPFNSGLSKGLIAALAEVKTPYTMRMDDDELLTPSTRVHDQLSFLQKHQEVDLAAVQMGHRRPKRKAELYSQMAMSKRLAIPVHTSIEGHEVVFKTPNVFLSRTESLRRVGYDPNIRMIDHHE